MALTNIPAIWSSQVLVALRAAIVFGAPGIANRNYQGEITQGGDRVRVTGITDPTIFDVTSNADIPAPETLADSVAEMVIDQQKGYNFQVDDLDQLRNARGGILLQSAQNAARRLAETADAYIAGLIAAAVPTANKVGTTGAPISVDAPVPGVAPATGAVDVYRVLVALRIKLDKKNVPADGRWAVIPAFMSGALALDPRFTNANADTLRNGFAGRAAGFDIYVSNGLTTGGTGAGSYTSVFAGSPLATSFAEQLVETVFYRPERRFADAVKGQYVYGGKVFYPNAVAAAYVHDASGLDA